MRGCPRTDGRASVRCSAVAHRQRVRILSRFATGPALVAALVAALLLCAFAGPAAAQSTPTLQAPAPVPPPTTPATNAPAPAAPTTGPGPAGGPRVVATHPAGEGGAPVKGVTITVSTDGTVVGRATSGADGTVAVALPGPGQYEVVLDRSTLPKGIALEPEAPASLKPLVQASGDRPVVFRLARAGAAVDEGPSTVERLASLLASGLRFGLVIALAAVGLSLVFGTTGLTNFAHGELITFGAIVTWYLNAHTGGLGLPLWLAAIGGIVAAGAFGAAFDLGVYKPLRRRGMPVMSQMVVSIGLAFAGRYLFSILFGANPQQFSQYAAQAPTVQLGPISVRPKDLVVTVIALAALVTVGLFLQRARLGTAIRAVSDNHDLSLASGIDVERVILMVWVLAGFMAGLSGVMLGSTDTVSWNMGQRVLLVMFAAVVLGGLGTIYGAMVGGLVVGIVSDLSTFWLDADLKIVVALATLVVALLVRPQGLFGVKVRTA